MVWFFNFLTSLFNKSLGHIHFIIPFITMGYTLAYFIFPGFFQKSRKAWIAKIPLLFGCFIFLRPVFFSSLYIFQAVFVLAYVLLVHRAWKHEPSVFLRLEKALVVMIGLVTVCVPLSVVFVFNRPHGCKKAQADPHVRFLFSFCDPNWKKVVSKHTGVPVKSVSAPEARSIFLSSDGKTVFAGTGFEDQRTKHFFLAIDRKTAKIKKAFIMYAVVFGRCYKGKCYCMVTVEKKIYVLNEKTLNWEKIISLPFEGWLMTFDKKNNRLFVASHEDGRLAVLDLNTLKKTIYPEQAPSYTAGNGPVGFIYYDTDSSKLFIARESYVSVCYFVGWPDRRPFYPLERYCPPFYEFFVNLGLYHSGAVNKELNELYLNTPWGGNEYVFDTKTGQYKGKFGVGSPREVAYDPKRKYLFVGNYVTGYLNVYYAPTRQKVKKFFIGRRNRMMSFEPKIDRLLVTSSNGFLEIRP